jgi:hypothetical protein
LLAFQFPLHGELGAIRLGGAAHPCNTHTARSALSAHARDRARSRKVGTAMGCTDAPVPVRAIIALEQRLDAAAALSAALSSGSSCSAADHPVEE